MAKKATLETIALEARVSKSTVSRALSSPELLKPETVKKILAIAREQHYIYTSNSMDYSIPITSNIGLIVASVEDSIHAALINGVQETIGASSFGLLIEYSNHHRTNLKKLLNNLLKRKVAGIIVAGTRVDDEEILLEAAEKGVPIVITWDTPHASDKLSYVGFDNYNAAYSITNYLCTMGHRRIAVITSPFRTQTPRIQERYQGYLDAMRANYGTEVETFEVDMLMPTLINGREAMRQILDSGYNPTAVFAAGDALAIGALRAAQDAGLSIPNDISIAGFDDIDFASFTSPPLTTVKVPAFEMGQFAVETIQKTIDMESNCTVNYLLDSHLVIRNSCGIASS